DSICYEFDEYYLNISNTTKIATILDPYIKYSVFAIGDKTNNAIFLLNSKIVYYSTTATLVSPNLTELSPEILLTMAYNFLAIQTSSILLEEIFSIAEFTISKHEGKTFKLKDISDEERSTKLDDKEKSTNSTSLTILNNEIDKRRTSEFKNISNKEGSTEFDNDEEKSTELDNTNDKRKDRSTKRRMKNLQTQSTSNKEKSIKFDNNEEKSTELDDTNDEKKDRSTKRQNE
ncbi:19477_t:CDS:2, partial [Dentiscutata erythropus]